MKTIGFVGAGNMARALGGGIGKQAGADSFSLVATDPIPAAVESFADETGGRGAADIPTLLAASDVVVLAVKPQVLAAVMADMKPHMAPRHLVISIVAGATLGGMAEGVGTDARIVRAMPNTPALVRQGMTVLVGGPHATSDDLRLAEGLFAAVGRAVIVDEEALLDAVTAVSGSGPGFLFAYAESMLQAAGAVGLPPDLAVQLVQQTILGSAVLWQESAEGVDVLRQRVTSPGGTTQAGLEALAARDFAAAVRAAIEAATARSRELSAG
ncbi:MAG: pyrroline-5-carboxylate reductase [Candidatus Binatia bacterium]|nr:pyrroline-5-carboxylate reductase [Candidatus Binatia bacterium]